MSNEHNQDNTATGLPAPANSNINPLMKALKKAKSKVPDTEPQTEQNTNPQNNGDGISNE